MLDLLIRNGTAVGYDATLERGVTIVDNGELTGERPGRLVRGTQG